MDTLMQDIRYGLRSLARRPAFTFAVCLTFGLGIGANTAIFSVVNGVLLRELPYDQPHRIVRLAGTEKGAVNVGGVLAWPNFKDIYERSGVFESAAAYDEYQPNLTGVGEPERLDAALVSTEFFDVLGVDPVAGRFFVAEEDIDGKDRVVVLSYGLWQRKFGGDTGIVGRTVDLNGRPHTVVGVAPQTFEDPKLSGPRWGEPALWRPLGLIGVSEDRLPSRGSHSYVAIARLRPDVTIQQARERIAAVSRQLQEEYPDENADVGMVPIPLRESIVGDVRSTLLVLLGVVAFVLAIAAANVGNLLLGRATERQHEIALRAALGATRLRILRQLATETLVLATVGGVLGVVMAAMMTDVVVNLGGTFIPRSAAVGLDTRVLAFAVGVTAAAGLLCGLVPAAFLSATDLRSALGQGSRTTGTARSRRLRAALVVSEVALAFLLLTGAGLLTKSLWNLSQVDVGIDPSHVLTFDLAPPYSRYSDTEALTALYDGLLERLRGLPRVEAAAVVNLVPLTGGFDGNTVTADDLPEPAPGDERSAQTRSVSPDYFRVMGISLRRGRLFSENDRAGAPPVSVINEVLARRFWPDQDPLGKRVTVAGTSTRVVGVVANVKHLNLEEPAPPRIYLPRAQGTIPWQLRYNTVVLRAQGDPALLAPAVREIVRDADLELPIAKLRTMEQIVTSSAAPPRFRTVLLGSFAGLALVLAAVGIYGVISYSVSQRVREMAIRMALGAGGATVLRAVLAEGLLPVAGGLAMGLIGSLSLTNLLTGFLYQVPAIDPLVFTLVPALMLLIAVTAILGPARRATQVDPMTVLREE